MSANRDPLVLEFLLRLNAKADSLTADLRELRDRVTRLEERLAALAATEAIHHATTLVALDRLQSRVARLGGGPTATDPSAEA